MTDMTREAMFPYDRLEDPADVKSGQVIAWVERVDGEDASEAMAVVLRDLRDLGYLEEDALVGMRAVPILMREESDVEARINYREGENCLVECTGRARHPYPYWRVERV